MWSAEAETEAEADFALILLFYCYVCEGYVLIDETMGSRITYRYYNVDGY